MTQEIGVYKIRSYAHHGCLSEETKIGGHYETNINIWFDFSSASQNDDLTKTINYADIYKIVRDQMKIPCKLIETLAHNMHRELSKLSENIEKIRVEIKKIAPPLNGDVKYIRIVVEM